MKVLVFFRHFSDTVAEALHFCLESGIFRRFPSRSTIAGGMVLGIAAILGRHSRMWGEEEATGPEGLIKYPSQLLFDATRLGNFEFLAALLSAYPDLFWELDENKRSIIHVAVLHRHASIFNLVHEIGFIKDFITAMSDDEDNNILHLAAKLAPQNQLNLVSGAALQMQRELVWFEEVKKIVQPLSTEMKNKKGKTPRELFTSEHKGLLHKGESWMKNTAKSCMLVATIIATVVFSAAFSIPGGIADKTGAPNFVKETAFLIFAISDGVALFSSSTSMLMFLYILTSRYAENDFLKSLPLKLMVGLASLFISMTSMMIAFSTAFYLSYILFKSYISAKKTYDPIESHGLNVNAPTETLPPQSCICLYILA
ncbi:hypothetical protein PRUPE_6G131100 [Prunus persica]|uniref:PGG domain-containing protein n=1 Tax=Prunus persica TaxID=3760 RepID=A0A251NPP3_PRUPE|nr:hypothetical protein PRUPE_6G131100 [Prunus persica]